MFCPFLLKEQKPIKRKIIMAQKWKLKLRKKFTGKKNGK